jgi:hypothetical protein
LKEQSLLRRALLFKKPKSPFNALMHRGQGTLQCARANLWAELLKRLGLVLPGNKNKSTKTKTAGQTKAWGQGGECRERTVFTVQCGLGLESSGEGRCCAHVG